MQGSTNKRIIIQACLENKVKPCLKNNQNKKFDRVAQVVECLPNKCEALFCQKFKESKNLYSLYK
jgi:hypothetical protein